MSQSTILLIGGNGKTGRRVAERLTAMGHNVRVASRSAEYRFLWDDPSTWKAVLEGVDGVYIAHHDNTHPDAGEQIASFSQLALSCGVRRQVLLSGRADAQFMASVESGFRLSAADWTILQPAWFMQNFSEMSFYEAVLTGEISLPVGNATEPFIDIEDVAAVAAEALFNDRHIGQTYELTGPALLGFAEAADVLTKAIGRNIVYKPITLDEFREFLRSNGLPEEYDQTYSGIADGKLAYVTDDVEQVLGRKPRTFAEYAREAASTGVWSI